MVTQTVSYDGSCNPIVLLSSHVTERMPEWKLDVWPGLAVSQIRPGLQKRRLDRRPWDPNLPNGYQNLTGLSIVNNDVIKVLAEDADGNRQWYEKTGGQLRAEYPPTAQPADPVLLPSPEGHDHVREAVASLASLSWKRATRHFL